MTSVRTGTRGASSRNSSPSRARQVGDRAERPLAPEDLVGEGRDLAHVDAGADHPGALRACPQRRRHQGADRGEDDRAVELLRRRLLGRARPVRAELAGELLRLLVAGAGEGEDPPSLVNRNLAEDVGGGAEPVEADALGVADQAQRPVADQAGAEQRRRLLVGLAVGDREAVALVGDGELRVAAVDVVAGEAGPVAEVLATAAAVAALAAGPAEPGDPDPVAAAKRSAPSPVAATRPTIWCPGTSGSFGRASSPSRMCRSVRQTPQAWTETRIWPGPGAGSSSSTGRSGSRGRSSSIALIAQ